MLKARSLWVGLVGVLLLTSWVVAQEAPPPRERPARAERPAANERQTLARLYEQMVKELQLTAEQQPQIKQMIETHVQAAENWMKEFGPKLQQLREQAAQAARENSRDKANELREEMRKLWQQRGQLREKLNEQILGVLTGQQKERFQALLRRAAAVRGPQPQVTLTPAQKGQVARILKAAAENANNADTPEAKEAVWNKAVEDVLNFINRPATSRQPERAQPGAGARGLLGQLSLTAEQQQQVEKIMAEAREKGQGADAEGRRKAFRDANQKIETEVLTPAQVEQLNKLREQRRGAGGEARPRRAGRPAAE